MRVRFWTRKVLREHGRRLSPPLVRPPSWQPLFGSKSWTRPCLLGWPPRAAAGEPHAPGPRAAAGVAELRAEALAKKAALRRLRGAAATRASRRATVRAARRTFVQVRRPRVEQKENAASRTPLACICEPRFKCQCFFCGRLSFRPSSGARSESRRAACRRLNSVRWRWSRGAVKNLGLAALELAKPEPHAGQRFEPHAEPCLVAPPPRSKGEGEHRSEDISNTCR